MKLKEFLDSNKSIINSNPKMIGLILKKSFDITFIKTSDLQYIGINHLVGELITSGCVSDHTRVEVNRIPDTDINILNDWIKSNIENVDYYIEHPLSIIFRTEIDPNYKIMFVDSPLGEVKRRGFRIAKRCIKCISIHSENFNDLNEFMTRSGANLHMPMTWTYLRYYTTNARLISGDDVASLKRTFNEYPEWLFDLLNKSIPMGCSNSFTSLVNQLFILSDTVHKHTDVDFNFIIPNINGLWNAAQSIDPTIDGQKMLEILNALCNFFNCTLIIISKYLKIFNIKTSDIDSGVDYWHMHLRSNLIGKTEYANSKR